MKIINMETLTPEQIKNWRHIISMTLESRIPGAGLYAYVMPESEVVAYWQRMKTILEMPEQPDKSATTRKPVRQKCNHENSITGQNGTYCLDCEKYID